MMKQWGTTICKIATAAMCFVGVFAISTEVNATSNYDYIVTQADATVIPNDNIADADGIQNVLDKAKGATEVVTIYIPAGTYHVDKALRIYSNTHLILDSAATIYRMDSAIDKMIIHNTDENGYMDRIGGYEMSKNITIEGGIWDGGNTKLATDATNIIRFDHAENITIKNATVKNTYDCHIIELVAVKNGLIDNCTLTGFRYAKGKEKDYEYAREAIQLEAAWTNNEKNLADEESHWAKGTYLDGTACQQVTVSNNKFIDVPCGVGQHHYAESGKGRNQNITITGNTFSCADKFKYCKTAITGCGTDNLTVTNNTVKGPYRFGVHVLGSSGVTIQGNSFDKISMNGLMIDSGTITAIKDNTISNAKKHGMSIGGGTIAEISGNTISNAKHNGISVDDGQVTSINNNIVTNATKHGISIAGIDDKAKGATVTDVTYNTITKAKQNGITVDAGKLTNLNFNTITSPGKHGISIAGKTKKSKGATITNINENTINKAKQNGISVDAGKITNINLNVIKNAGKHGISLTGTSPQRRGGTIKNVIGNTITKAKWNGISMDKGKVTIISQNKITNVSKHGISVVGGTVGTGKKKTNGVLDNTIKTCKNNGITVSGTAKVSTVGKNKITSVKNNAISLTEKAKVQNIIKNTLKKYAKHDIWNGTSCKPKIAGNKK